MRGRWVRISSLVGLSAAVALTIGPLLGALLIFATDLPFAFLNIVSGIVYAAALPFVGLVTAYAYLDARARGAGTRAGAEGAPGRVPALRPLAGRLEDERAHDRTGLRGGLILRRVDG